MKHYAESVNFNESFHDTIELGLEIRRPYIRIELIPTTAFS